MKRPIIVLISLLAFALTVQGAKMPKNATKALLRITTFTSDGKPLKEGYGFFITSEGEALSTFDLFKGAYKAELTDEKGKKWTATRICGANSLYNIVRFQTNCTKAVALPIATEKMEQGHTGWVICPNNKTPLDCGITSFSLIDSMRYYTLSNQACNQLAGCPLVNTQGMATGLIQAGVGKDSTTAFALDIAFASLLHTSGMSAAETALNSIYIPKALPTDLAQARTYIFLATQNLQDSIIYETALADFMQTYPEESAGYIQAMTYWASKGRFEKAEEYYTQSLDAVKEKADIHYEMSKLIYRLNMLKNYSVYKDWNLERALQEASDAYTCHALPLFLMQKADCEFALRKYADAFTTYQAVNASDVSSPKTFAAAAISAEMAGMDSLTILSMLDSAIVRCGATPNATTSIYLLQRAAHLDKYGRYKEAARDYQQVEDIRGTSHLNDNFFYMKSLCDTRARLYARALNDIDKALSIRPNDYGYMVEKALAEWRMGNYDEAIYAAQKALKINPQGADAYKAWGLACGEQGKKEEALKHLAKAKELGDPQAQALMDSLQGK